MARPKVSIEIQKAKQAERLRKWYLKNKEKHIQQSKDNYTNNKEKILKYKKEWHKNHADLTRDRNLKQFYGFSLAEYDVMFATQNGCCKICKKTSERNLHVDHCHKTNKVRGLLCGKCNTGIGQFNDNIELLESAIAYLKEQNA